VSPVQYAGGKRPLRAYIAVCLQIHFNPSSLQSPVVVRVATTRVKTCRSLRNDVVISSWCNVCMSARCTELTTRRRPVRNYRRSQHLQRCHDEQRQCFCRRLTAKNSTHGKTGGSRQQHRPGKNTQGKPGVASMVWRRGIAVGKTQRRLCTQPAWILRAEDRHRPVVTRDLDL